MPQVSNNQTQYLKLEQRLILLAWLNDRFGYKSNRNLLADMKEADVEVFLLRNLSRGTGIGFFETRRFYPDFILWIMGDGTQHIVFLEPHGMIHEKTYKHDEKAHLHEVLPNLAREIAARSKRQDITLDSYIISATPYEELYQKYDDGSWDRDSFAEAHILFLERSDEYDSG